jgi:hypothetical protein
MSIAIIRVWLDLATLSFRRSDMKTAVGQRIFLNQNQVREGAAGNA